MKTKYCNKLLWFIIIALFMLTFGNTDAAIAAEPLQMAIIPFKMNAEKDLTFLQQGIADMLTSRLSKNENVSVINREETVKAAKSVSLPLNDEKARGIGIQLDANYVIFGSVTIFGDSVSIDAKMVDVSKVNPTLTFSNQSRDAAGEVIPKVSLFATEIMAVISEPLSVNRPEDFQKPSESMVQKDEEIEKKESQPEKKLNPAFIVSNHQAEKGKEFWKSQEFNYLINGMASGDVDADGKNEVVCIAPHDIHIFRLENSQLDNVKTIEESQYKIFIGVDIADINGNGFPEIFITSLNSLRNSLNSMVFEWNGTDYVKILDNSPWYFRIVSLPGKVSILLGQQNTSYDPFSGDIVEMAWQDTDYVPKETVVSASARANLMGFAFGDLMNTSKPVAVAYDTDDYIQITDPPANLIWKGSEHYGGSHQYCSMPRTEPGYDNWEYLPLRLCITDSDSDGKNEVITVKNYEMTGRLLQQFRKFTNAHIEAFSWNGLGLATKWKTSKISGYISDFAIGDIDNDGANEFAASVILKDGAIIGTRPKSTLIVYDLTQ